MFNIPVFYSKSLEMMMMINHSYHLLKCIHFSFKEMHNTSSIRDIIHLKYKI